MDKLTKRLIKNFITIITIVITICSIGSSIFISKAYLNRQYDELEDIAENMHYYLRQGEIYKNPLGLAIIIQDDTIVPIGGMMHEFRKCRGTFDKVDFHTLPQKGKIEITESEDLLYYKLNTEFGDLVVFKNRNDIYEHIRLIFGISITMFILGMLIGIPLIGVHGKKITKPIIEIQKAADKIANGEFLNELNINTQDEIEELSKSIEYMSDEISKKNRLQKEFIANVSHDFRTPLSIIRNTSEAICDGILEQDEIAVYSNDIIDEVDKLNKLVQDLLQLSKLQSGKINLNKEDICLDEFLNHIISKFNIIANEKNIKFNLKVDDVTVSADYSQLSRVIYNLINNAIKFSYENNKVDIQAVVEENKFVKISIKDYGRGIENSKLEDIWNRYYKHSTSGGVGLGLAISSEILKSHGFEYGVNSEYGKGTEFFILIPIEV